MEQAITEIGGFAVSGEQDLERLRAYAKGLGIEGMEQATRGKVITEIFETTCEGAVTLSTDDEGIKAGAYVKPEEAKP